MNDWKCLVVFYHYVRDVHKTSFPRIKALGVQDFRSQLDWLARSFEPISFSRLRRLIEGEEEASGRFAHLTFDDGLVDHHRVVFPILRERGLSGTFFLSEDVVVADPRLLTVHMIHFLLARLGNEEFDRRVEERLSIGRHAMDRRERPGIYRYDERKASTLKRRLNYEVPFEEADHILRDLFQEVIGSPTEFARELYLDERMIREMAVGGQTFGGHTRRHRVLSRLSQQEQEEELRSAPAWIRRVTGQVEVPFCFPYGHQHTYDDGTLESLERLGYSVAFNTVRTCLTPRSPRFELPRLDTKDIPPFTDYEC